MLRRFSTNFAVFSVFVDGLLISLALYLSIFLRQFSNQFDFVQLIPPIPVPPELYVLFPFIWVLTLLVFSIYDGRKNIRVVDEFASLTLASFFATIASAGVLYLSFRDISRFQFALFAFTAYILMLFWRVIVRTTIHRRFEQKKELRNVLILGAGTAGRKIGEQINRGAMYGLHVIGYLDDDPAKSRHADVVGDLNIAREIVSHSKIDDVVIALPGSAYQRLNQIVSELHDLPVRVWVIPDYFFTNLT